MTEQQGWKWCFKCNELTFDHKDFDLGTCPVRCEHNHRGSGNYVVDVSDPNAKGQKYWRWCNKCQALFFGGKADAKEGGVCPAGGAHASPTSGDYTLAVGDDNAPGQKGWLWCKKCQVLFFKDAKACPAGGVHDSTGSGKYTVKTK